MNIYIENLDNPLLKETWRFYVYDHGDKLHVKLYSYWRTSRPSTRHKNWTLLARWDAYASRDNTMSMKPECPQHVLDDVIMQARGAIVVV